MNFTKKYLASLSVVVLIVIFGRLLVPKTSLQNNNFSQIPTATIPTADAPAPETSAPPVSSTPSTPSSNLGQYKNGTYTGPVEDASYGNVQVKLTVSSGKITQVAILQYPSDNGTSQEINSYAIPKLQSEVISKQSANIDAVSGASFTSQAFYQSLKSALAQAS